MYRNKNNIEKEKKMLKVIILEHWDFFKSNL